MTATIDFHFILGLPASFASFGKIIISNMKFRIPEIPPPNTLQRSAVTSLPAIVFIHAPVGATKPQPKSRLINGKDDAEAGKSERRSIRITPSISQSKSHKPANSCGQADIAADHAGHIPACKCSRKNDGDGCSTQFLRPKPGGGR